MVLRQYWGLALMPFRHLLHAHASGNHLFKQHSLLGGWSGRATDTGQTIKFTKTHTFPGKYNARVKSHVSLQLCILSCPSMLFAVCYFMSQLCICHFSSIYFEVVVILEWSMLTSFKTIKGRLTDFCSSTSSCGILIPKNHLNTLLSTKYNLHTFPGFFT